MEALQFKTQALLHREQFEIEVGHQPQNALMILKEGRFFCSFSNENTFIAEPGDLIFFPVKQKFTRKVLEPCTFHLIYFTLSDQNPFSNYLPTGKIELREQARVSYDISIFDEMPYDTDYYAEAMKHHALNDIFLMFFHEYTPKQSLDNRLSPQIRKVVQYCSEHISEQITLQTMADIARMSTSTLSRHFRSETGFSPTEYLIRLRLLTASKELLSSSHSISEIAELCGYENVYYFSNTFKKVYGYPPSKYRKRKPRA